MPRNQKLTAVIEGRAVQSAAREAGKLVIVFDVDDDGEDGSRGGDLARSQD